MSTEGGRTGSVALVLLGLLLFVALCLVPPYLQAERDRRGASTLAPSPVGGEFCGAVGSPAGCGPYRFEKN